MEISYIGHVAELRSVSWWLICAWCRPGNIMFKRKFQSNNVVFLSWTDTGAGESLTWSPGGRVFPAAASRIPAAYFMSLFRGAQHDLSVRVPGYACVCIYTSWLGTRWGWHIRATHMYRMSRRGRRQWRDHSGSVVAVTVAR